MRLTPLLLGILVLWGLGCQQERPTGQAQAFEGRGRVAGVDRATPLVFVDHGEIPGFMTAMTMSYPLKDPGLLEGLSPGDSIRFTIEVTEDGFRITAIRTARLLWRRMKVRVLGPGGGASLTVGETFTMIRGSRPSCGRPSLSTRLWIE